LVVVLVGENCGTVVVSVPWSPPALNKPLRMHHSYSSVSSQSPGMNNTNNKKSRKRRYTR
jgi:hypothetical protein